MWKYCRSKKKWKICRNKNLNQKGGAMDKNLFIKLVSWLIDRLDTETVRRAADALFDVVENRIAESENKIDDKLILPVINLMRKTFHVPDNDESEGAAT